ncbi:MAG TPA: hypothetical protein VKU01_30715 [Bryobacteraceae bacterium]|nr:hypothetical protein [Bryobacteraceae bacterium]
MKSGIIYLNDTEQKKFGYTKTLIGTGYLSRLSQTLAAHVPTLHPQYTFTVYDDRKGISIPRVPVFPEASEIAVSGDALILPGGPVFVPLSTVTFAWAFSRTSKGRRNRCFTLPQPPTVS